MQVLSKKISGNDIVIMFTGECETFFKYALYFNGIKKFTKRVFKKYKPAHFDVSHELMMAYLTELGLEHDYKTKINSTKSYVDTANDKLHIYNNSSI